MSDESTAIERLIERGHAELSADIARLEAQQSTHHADVLSQLDRYLLTKVYDADERARDAQARALAERLQRLEMALEDDRKRREKEAEEEETRRKDETTANQRMLRSSIVVAVFGVISTVVSAALVAALVKGGAH